VRARARVRVRVRVKRGLGPAKRATEQLQHMRARRLGGKQGRYGQKRSANWLRLAEAGGRAGRSLRAAIFRHRLPPASP
jgi:hypothetical protein